MSVRRLTNRSQSFQQALFHEDIYGAIAGLVSALGGAKVVGSRLMPDLSVDAAHKRLLNAINPDHAQQITLTQFMTLLKWGLEAGVHGAMEYIADETGYTRPSPRAPEDVTADLYRRVIELGAELSVLTRKLQK